MDEKRRFPNCDWKCENCCLNHDYPSLGLCEDFGSLSDSQIYFKSYWAADVANLVNYSEFRLSKPEQNMPGLILDDGSWKEMAVPSTTTIGRSGDNMIQPESQSVSKKHATIHMSIDHRGRQQCTVEDHSSRNGTFWGPSPYDREQQRVDKTQIIPYGTFLKFGNSNTYFNYLEEKPREDIPIAYDPLAHKSPPTLKREDTQESELLVNSNIASGENTESNALVPFAPPRSASPVELGGLNTSGESLRGSGGGGVAVAPVLANSNNMMISIQYPHGKENNPVSIHIDPKGQGPPAQASFTEPRSNRSSGHYSDADHDHYPPPRHRGSRRSEDRPLRESRQRSGRESREWMDVEGRGSQDSPISGEIGRGVQRYNSQALSSRGGHDNDYGDDEDESDMPPPLAETGLRNAAPADVVEMRGSRGRGSKRSASPPPPLSPRSGVDLDDFRHHHHHHDEGQRHNPFPLSPIKGSFGFPYPGKTTFQEKANPLLVRRAWPDISVVPITALTSTVSHDLNSDQLYEGYDEKAPMPSVEDFSGDLPPYVRSEAVADRFREPEDTVCGKLGGAIAELNDLLKQAIVGAQVKSPQQSQQAAAGGSDPVADAVSAELEAALQTLVNDILVRSINTLQQLLRHNLISAFAEADGSRECHNDVMPLLTNACGRLERVLAFSNGKGFGKAENQKYAKKARSSERHAVVAYALHYSVLSELDIANCLLFSATQEAVAEEELKMNPLGKGKSKGDSAGGARGSRDEGAKVRGSHDTGASIQLELEELRRLKGRASRKGGSAALAAQIRELEEKAVSHAGKGVVAVDGSLDFGPLFMPAAGAGEQTQRYDTMELKRLREQEDAEGHKYQRFARALYIATNNVRRFWNYAFRRWRNVVNDMKRDYTNKMRHFAYCLKDRGHSFLRNAFRKLAKHAQVEREQERVDQVRAELRYEMCGMQQKIHELSSQNTLAASLAAERALNRELTDLNLELRNSITELDGKLLEVVNVEPAERKELVRDVLFGREDALSMARREAKALRDELQELYDLGIRLPEGPRKNIMESAPVPPSFKRPKDPKAEPLPETIDKSDKRLRDTAPLTDGRQNTRPLALKEQALPEVAAGLASKKQFLPHRGDLSVTNPMRPLVKNHNKELAPVQGRFLDDDNRRLINGLTRKDATIIIAKEVRRLTDSLRKTTFERNRMQKRLTHDATKHMQQTLAVEALQKRITDRERSLTQLRKLLKEKRFVGDKGLVELTIALEDSGVGNSAILMEPSSLDDPTVDYSNVPPLEPFRFGPPGNPEKPNELQSKIGPVDVTRQRESYQDAVDDALRIVDPAKAAAEEELKRQILEEAGARSDKAFPVPAAGASG